MHFHMLAGSKCSVYAELRVALWLKACTPSMSDSAKNGARRNHFLGPNRNSQAARTSGSMIAFSFDRYASQKRKKLAIQWPSMYVSRLNRQKKPHSRSKTYIGSQ